MELQRKVRGTPEDLVLGAVGAVLVVLDERLHPAHLGHLSAAAGGSGN